MFDPAFFVALVWVSRLLLVPERKVRTTQAEAEPRDRRIGHDRRIDRICRGTHRRAVNPRRRQPIGLVVSATVPVAGATGAATVSTAVTTVATMMRAFGQRRRRSRKHKYRYTRKSYKRASHDKTPFALSSREAGSH